MSGLFTAFEVGGTLFDKLWPGVCGARLAFAFPAAVYSDIILSSSGFASSCCDSKLDLI